MSSAKSHPPYRTVIFLLVIGVGIWSFRFLPQHYQISETLEIKMPHWPNFTNEPEQERLTDANAFLEGYDELLKEDSIQRAQDSIRIETAIQDSIAKAVALRRQLLSIQEGEKGITNLNEFFASLRSLSANSNKVRVMHYGDSQIEADRISNYLRKEWQAKWGGHGPGLVPPVEVVPSGAIKQKASENWSRHTIYGKKDTTVTHNRYGVLGTFATYDSTSATLNFEPSRLGYSNTRTFDEGLIFIGVNGAGGSLQVMHNEEVIKEVTLADSSGFTSVPISLSGASKSIQLSFTGGPMECYGMTLDSDRGVQLDNIPMRGSSGTIFKKMNRSLFKAQMKILSPELIFLQYGGNSVPYVKDTLQADNYGKWLSSQIKYIQSAAPDAAIILIGPSDMAHKVDDQFETYAYLEPVRDALKKAAFDNGCGFWDIYEAMGGRNSMQAWVEAEPALAGPDYVHFTSGGAKKIAQLLNKAIMDRYLSFEKAQEELKKTKEKVAPILLQDSTSNEQ